MPKYLIQASYTADGIDGKARTVVLLAPEQVDAAAQRSVEYPPPGS
jgi:hypothetical protein